MNRNPILLASAMAIWGVGEGTFLSSQPLYLQQLGADPVQIGMILGGLGIAMAAAHLPAGYLSDRFGRRPLLHAAWVIATLAAALMALASSMPLFVLGAAFYGLTSFVAGPLNSYITTARGDWKVGRALTLMSAAYNSGAILGPLIGGWIGKYGSLRTNFYLAAGLFVVSTLVVLQLPPQPVESADAHPPGRALRGLLQPRFIRFLVIAFLGFFAMYVPLPLSQNFLVNERGVDLWQIGQLLSRRSAGIIVLSPTIGRLNARPGFFLAQAGMAGFTILIWQGANLPWYAAAYVLMGSYNTARALAAAQARSLVGAANMGLAYGLLETVSVLAIVLAPPLAGYLYAIEPASIYPVATAGILLALLIGVFWMPVKVKELL